MNPRPRLLVALHWASVCLLLAGVTAIFVRMAVESRTGRLGLLDLHRGAGLLVLTLVVARLLTRWRTRPTNGRTLASTVAERTAAGVHALLYLLLVAIPLIGWRLSGAMGSGVRLFGISLPDWGTEDEDAADFLGAWHERLAWGLGALVVVHVGAALWHHFILKDDVLSTMAPWRVRRANELATRAPIADNNLATNNSLATNNNFTINDIATNNNLITPGEGNASIE